ncbi:hypothetical protein CesoFtcFv8_002582 [Champsocephalus esox]|uniref:Uncharacterized protein n=2 Tax=Champsocephalus TaxID=52236 RepID=A0AAN8E3S2_CHAGU|nr:hypothetical protein CesoFtcFv8_002582 [Champsocephalus esox]KAK5934235.1 hypothetical protein CgunFtcFv8_014650 [Champsocephalus gunnari]
MVHRASTGPLCPINTLLLGLFSSKELPISAAQHWINVMSSADKLLLNRLAPASQGRHHTGSPRLGSFR